MDARIQTHINILPFGNIQYTSKGGVVVPVKTKETVRYQAPQTTDVDGLEFGVCDDITSVIPDVGEDIALHL